MPVIHIFKRRPVAIAAATFVFSMFIGHLELPAAADTPDYTVQQPSTVRVLGVLHASDMDNMQDQNVAPRNRDMASDQGGDLPPQAMQVNGITYITGGIGDEERSLLQAIKKDYNLHLTSSSKSGEFMGDVRVVISDRSGNELLNVEAGPIFYAELPAGSYNIEARSEGQKQQRHITVGKESPSSLHMTWL